MRYLGCLNAWAVDSEPKIFLGPARQTEETTRIAQFQTCQGLTEHRQPQRFSAQSLGFRV